MQTNSSTNSLDQDKQWPDFYKTLDLSPEADIETLRRSINALYVKANEQSEHQEMSTRFYNQVLAQKVLPQCRRILLNDHSRQAYNRQWHLHREGAATALSYQDFVREISTDSGTARALLLSDDEISLLPSFGTPTQAKAPDATPVSSGATAQPAAPSKKGAPLVPILAGLVVLAIGGVAFNASRTPALTQPEVAAPVAAAIPVAPPTSASAPLMQLNTLAKNSDFEDGKMGWDFGTSSAYVETGVDKNCKSGEKRLGFWGSEKGDDATVSQTITGLKPGKYTLRAWARRGGGQINADMFASDYGGPKRKVTLPLGWAYTRVTIANIDVTSGKCTIGFNVKSLASKTTNVDAVEFFRQP